MTSESALPARSSSVHRTPIAGAVSSGHAALARMRALQALHAGAVRACPAEYWQASCVFAGRPARLRVVGRALGDVMAAAFGHLTSDPVTPELTIDLWDESVTHTSADAEDDIDEGRTWLVGSGLLTSVCGGRVIRHQLPHSTAWLDRETRAIVGSVLDANGLSLYERGKPLHYLLSLWHNDRRAFVTHGALVARGGEGVLLAGVGGSGKSTLAAACLAQGFDYLGDDCIAVERGGADQFVGHSLFASPWLDDASLRRLPALADHAVVGTRPGEDKALVEIRRGGDARLARSAPIVAIGLPRIARQRATRVRRATRGEAMRALGPSTILLFAPSPGADGLRHLGALVKGVPSFWIDLGEELAEAPSGIDAVLAAARAEREASTPPA